DTTGRLGYLRVRVAAPAPSPTDPSSSFSGDFAVDLMSNSSRSRLMANDVSLNRIDINQALVPSLTATTNVHLGLTTDFFQADFPEIKADFHLDWIFDPQALNNQGLAGGVPHIVFNDIRLNVGQFFSKFISPIVTEINNVLRPIQPIIDFLNKP